MTDDSDRFALEVQANISNLRNAEDLQKRSLDWIRDTAPYKYSYNFRWLGRPIIQFPQDMVALQELIWKIRPDVIVETGIAHGGSLVFYASMLELLGGMRKVIGIDVDIRPHNRAAIERHPMMKRISLIEGSSVDNETVKQVNSMVRPTDTVLVVLDSNHTHAHVLAELRAYSPLVKVGSYLVVLDTVIEDMPADLFPDRPWGPGNNPKTAVRSFLQENDRFKIDADIDAKLLITVGLSGYLRCIRDPAKL
jgi:cephalosporin hydroxylase